MKMDMIIHAVNQWADDKGITEKATPRAQAKKTLEEAGELLEAICDGDKSEIELELGDVFVTAIIGCKLQGITPEQALESAYRKISGRKGEMVNGQFVRAK